ncbi:gamma-glutamyltransferase [Glycomyces sp. NPDC046736]|uniref:gamma-glutamyltransferase family protein n=1 Tax=Glycomyces sp. NPDC046736 TaxID=3155615 RepID=UPI0033D26035
MTNVMRARRQWGRDHMVSTASTPATLAALAILDEGGNAFDAAIGISAVLTVNQPMACGPAGDAAIVCHSADSASPVSLTALGRAPMATTPEALRDSGHATVPSTGPLSISTPALTDAWFALHERYGRLGMERILAPAVELAESGTTITGQDARWAQVSLEVLRQPHFKDLFGAYASPSAPGSVLRQPGLARLLRLVIEHNGRPERFRAILGEAVESACTSEGALIRAQDCLADHAVFEPAATTSIGDWTIATTPAPTQGPVLLQNLALYARLASDTPLDSAAGIHMLAEIANQTYGYRLETLGDPEAPPATDALAPAVLERLAANVNDAKTSPPTCLGKYSQGDTTHFAVLDSDGNGVSWVQSLGLGFGSGVGVPEFDMLLCNRLGRSATLDDGDPNRLSPGRRPVNTILPWAVTELEGLRWLGGTPGGDGQTQWNAQVVLGLLLEQLNPLQALARPRWTYYPGADKAEAAMGLQLRVDANMSDAVIEELRGFGYDVVPKPSVGGVMRILERADGHHFGLDDGRHEGLTAGR